MDRRETERILAAVRRAAEDGVRVAIATVVRVRGSAYRREGARMLVRGDDGSFECLLSGGCLEPAVADAAARVIATGQPVTVEYDLAEDSPWGLSIGCSGAVDVRIERVENDPLTVAWFDILDRGEAAVLITPLAGARGRQIVMATGETLGHLDAGVETRAMAAARQRLAVPQRGSGPVRIGDVELFLEVSDPPASLVIFGAGPDALPLARQARDLGFLVTVADVREALLIPDRLPGATLKAVDHNRFPEAVPLTDRSYVVIMNHHLERDEHSLRHALGSEAPYIGLLGPRSRYLKLLARLRKHGGLPGPESLGRVRSPVGLALGAETPEEIAVSILGELLALRRGFEGGFLTGRDASLHRPDDNSVLARS
jgi:xanthine/CO dehydrogenase XdhC/CoxF family maturation factor